MSNVTALKKYESYRPGSGSEGLCFYERWCFRCARDAHFNSGKDFDTCEPHEICTIIADTLAYDIRHPKYPKEWVYGENGPMCSAFVPVERGLPPERCKKTIDMFDGDSQR